MDDSKRFPVDGAEIFYLSLNGDSIVVVDDNDGCVVSIAKIEPSYTNLVRLLLRQAQLGAQAERLLDHYLADIHTRGTIPCPMEMEVHNDDG